MKVHWLQHASFEGLGTIAGWMRAHGHALSCTQFYADDAPPEDPDAFDWLIVMGGPMNVYQYRDHPWLRPEKRLIRETIAAGKRVLGVCLGAQLISAALGGKVVPNGEREIGWFPVWRMPDGAASRFAFPAETSVFHWHGDTFSLPPGGTWLARSEGCAHQAFAVGPRVLGLQFHLEITAADIGRLAQTCADELTPGRYVQPVDKMLREANAKEPAVAALLDQLLTTLAAG